MSMNQFYENIKQTIARAGIQIIGVGSDGSDPPFSYTIGFSEKHGYELIVLGLPPQYAAIIFNRIYAMLEEGTGLLELDVPDTRWSNSNLPFVFKACGQKLVSKYTIQANEYYGKPIKVVQMVMADRAGRLPSDPAFDAAYMGQFQQLLYPNH